MPAAVTSHTQSKPMQTQSPKKPKYIIIGEAAVGQVLVGAIFLVAAVIVSMVFFMPGVVLAAIALACWLSAAGTGIASFCETEKADKVEEKTLIKTPSKWVTNRLYKFQHRKLK